MGKTIETQGTIHKRQHMLRIKARTQKSQHSVKSYHNFKRSVVLDSCPFRKYRWRAERKT